jgi:hypothetical protein
MKALMNHSVGLNTVLTKRDSLKGILLNIDSKNPAMKAQIIELLAAISVFSKEGHEYKINN